MLNFSKSVFYISLSLFLLLFCFHATSYINHIEYQRHEAAIQKIEKRKRLDKYYLSEFTCVYDYMHYCPDDKSNSYKRIVEIEKNAFDDGYDRSEIAKLRSDGDDRSFERRQLQKN